MKPARMTIMLAAALLALGCGESGPVAGPGDEASALVAELLPPGAIPVTTCGTVISQPGDYWLTKDVIRCTWEREPAIRITASNVKLHLNGHRIETNPRRPAFTCIEVSGGDNVVIVGPGTLGFCLQAMYLGGTRVVVRGIRLVEFYEGITMPAGGQNTVENVTFLVRNQGYAAITVAEPEGGEASGGHTFRHNTITGASIGTIMTGFWIGGSDNLIEGNRIQGVGVGIEIRQVSSGNTVARNDVSGALQGITVAGSSNLISGNVFHGNDWDMTGSCDNTWIGNQFTNADPECLQ